MQTIRALLFPAAVAAALAFGGSAALATPPAAQTCQDPNAAGGTCTSQIQCKQKCSQLGYGYVGYCELTPGVFNRYCCYCEGKAAES